MLDIAAPGATFLLNAPYGADGVWDHLPRRVQRAIIDKKLRFYVIDALRVAREAGMGGRINTVMQTCFFALSGVLPRDEAIAADQGGDPQDLRRRGEAVVERNFAAVDGARRPARGRRPRRRRRARRLDLPPVSARRRPISSGGSRP